MDHAHVDPRLAAIVTTFVSHCFGVPVVQVFIVLSGYCLMLPVVQASGSIARRFRHIREAQGNADLAALLRDARHRTRHIGPDGRKSAGQPTPR